MKKSPPSELTPKWFRREKVGGESIDKKGRRNRSVTQELVYGQDRKSGTAYHELSGPTAAASIDALVLLYNQTGYLPPENMPPKCRADGAALPKDGGKDQMQFNLLHRETV